MELKLESGLEHQRYAVEAICDVFKDVRIDDNVAHYSNPIVNLASDSLIPNIKGIQRRPSQNVAERFREKRSVGNPVCLDIKMETGTGKTYVYTHTIFELHRL